MPVRSPYPDVEIPETSLFDFLFSDFGGRDAEPAFIDGTNGTSITYAELRGMVERVAAALAERGIGKGDVVGIFAPNTPYYPVVFHGVLRANAIVTSANSLYSPGELAHQLEDSGAKLLFTVSPFLDRAVAGAEQAGLTAADVIVLDGAEGHTSLRELLGSTAAVPDLDTAPGDTAVLPYSSGTTGLAKGVILTHRNLVANLQQIAAVMTVNPDTRILAVLPFFHIYGMTVMMNQGLHANATVVTMPRFDLPEFLRIISEHRIQRVYIAPPVAVALAKHPIVDQYDLSCIDVIFSGAAPLDAELGHAMGKRLGCTVLQGYGMTELSPVSHCMPDDRPDLDLNSSGFALPNIECKLVDPQTGEEVGPGGRGELWVKGPNVMVGYLNNPDATAATLDDEGYLHTGDVAEVTEEGGVLHRRPGQGADQVQGLPGAAGRAGGPAAHPRPHRRRRRHRREDDEGEEVPKAFVVTQPGAELSAEDVMAFVAERIAPHKKVRVVEFIAEIPKSASGKILRKDLRAREAAGA
jgi:acyl-CoA synthetase (AMP-forming)/AMP-acid ligase II